MSMATTSIRNSGSLSIRGFSNVVIEKKCRSRDNTFIALLYYKLLVAAIHEVGTTQCYANDYDNRYFLLASNLLSSLLFFYFIIINEVFLSNSLHFWVY